MHYGSIPRGDMLSAPIFIVGEARSGTTMARSLLSAHSRVVVTPESFFLTRAERFGGLGQREPERCEAFWQSYTADRRFLDLDVDPDRCRELAAASTLREGIAALFYGTLEAYRERHGKPRVGEKTPDHVRFVPSILAKFPDARILVMQRDPRAVVASQLRMPWNPYHKPSFKNGLIRHTRLQRVARRAFSWNRIYADLIPKVRDDERVHVVKYEDLVDAPKNQIKHICTFIGEEFEKTMLTERSYSTVPEFVAFEKLDPATRQWAAEQHERSLQPIDDAARESWKDELRPVEVALIEGCCAAAMRDAGYELVSSETRRHALGALAPAVHLTARVEGRVRRALKLPEG